jgi:hypothetical protein
MGWRERDYGRFNDDERRALFGGGRGRALPPSVEGRAHGRLAPPPIRRPTRRSRQSTNPATLLAVAISGAALVFAGYVANVPGLRSILNPHLHTTPASLPSAQLTSHRPRLSDPGGTLTVVWRPTDLLPAAHAGRICVTDSRHGRVCASFVIGERPADNLTREIERRGLHVQSSG